MRTSTLRNNTCVAAVLIVLLGCSSPIWQKSYSQYKLLKNFKIVNVSWWFPSNWHCLSANSKQVCFGSKEDTPHSPGIWFQIEKSQALSAEEELRLRNWQKPFTAITLGRRNFLFAANARQSAAGKIKQGIAMISKDEIITCTLHEYAPQFDWNDFLPALKNINITK